MKKHVQTTAPVEAGNAAGLTPEFIRTRDVKHVYGLPRGSLYNLLARGLVRGVVLRVTGRKSGIRLWDVASIREFIASQMQEAK